MNSSFSHCNETTPSETNGCHTDDMDVETVVSDVDAPPPSLAADAAACFIRRSQPSDPLAQLRPSDPPGQLHPSDPPGQLHRDSSLRQFNRDPVKDVDDEQLVSCDVPCHWTIGELRWALSLNSWWVAMCLVIEQSVSCDVPCHWTVGELRCALSLNSWWVAMCLVIEQLVSCDVPCRFGAGWMMICSGTLRKKKWNFNFVCQSLVFSWFVCVRCSSATTQRLTQSWLRQLCVQPFPCTCTYCHSDGCIVACHSGSCSQTSEFGSLSCYEDYNSWKHSRNGSLNATDILLLPKRSGSRQSDVNNDSVSNFWWG